GPRGGRRPVALARLGAADHDDRFGARQEIAGAMLLRGVRVERRRVGDAADGGARIERDRLQLGGGAREEIFGHLSFRYLRPTGQTRMHSKHGGIESRKKPSDGMLLVKKSL